MNEHICKWYKNLYGFKGLILLNQNDKYIAVNEFRKGFRK